MAGEEIGAILGLGGIALAGYCYLRIGKMGKLTDGILYRLSKLDPNSTFPHQPIIQQPFYPAPPQYQQPIMQAPTAPIPVAPKPVEVIEADGDKVKDALEQIKKLTEALNKELKL